MEGAAAVDQGTLFLEETLAEDDSVYNLDCDADALKKEGWKTDPKFFKKVRVSGAATVHPIQYEAVVETAVLES